MLLMTYPVRTIPALHLGTSVPTQYIGILLYFVVDDSIDLLHPVIACNALLMDDSILFTFHNCL